jgi:hypothetical protein
MQMQCFKNNESGCDNYRPLLWYKDSDKLDYENDYNIEHSKCYTEIHMNTQENIVNFVKKN